MYLIIDIAFWFGREGQSAGINRLKICPKIRALKNLCY